MGSLELFQYTIKTTKTTKRVSTMQKLFSVALVATVAIAQEAPEERKFSHIVKMVHDQISRAGSTWDSTTVSKRLQNYACHCFPGNSRVVVVGVVVVVVVVGVVGGVGVLIGVVVVVGGVVVV